MGKQSTIVESGGKRRGISKAEDSILMLGSCFSNEIGNLMQAEGYDVCINPFGTIFNPASIASSLKRLASGIHFTEDECIMMGAGSGLWCDFSHYTKFARADRKDFLKNANERLLEASSFYGRCTKVILTFGTAWVFKYVGDQSHPMFGKVVSNCLKIPARDFSRERLEVRDIVDILREFMATDGTFGKDSIIPKDIILTVSPIRHMADGAHGNMISKSTLMLATEELARFGKGAEYFPAYEILMDELRDYSWYAEDLVHPSKDACRLIWERFRDYITV